MKRATLLGIVFLLVLHQAAAQTARLVTPLSPPPALIQTGIQAIQDALADQGWDVIRAEGPAAAEAPASADLEIIISPFNESLFPAQQVAQLRSVVASTAQSFSIFKIEREANTRVYAIGSDEQGALYAALELAGQLAAPFPASLKARIQEQRGTAETLIRGVAVPITEQALRDGFSWFHSEDYWLDFLRFAAECRFNRLALRGAIAPQSGASSDLLAYWSQSAGAVDATLAQRNAASLQRIVELAAAHGIDVTIETLMSPGERPPDQVKRLAAETLELCPRLAGLGFAPSADSQEIRTAYASFLEGMMTSGSEAQLVLTTRDAPAELIRALSRAFPGGTVAQAPLNAVELGLDYILPGGEGNERLARGTWDYIAPPRPYALLYHIRPYAMHELLPWADVSFMRRVMRAALANASSGFIIELAPPYAPHAAIDSKTAPPNLRFAEWMHQRDWYAYQLWGRLGYNPDTEEPVFVRAFQQRFGEESGARLYQALQLSSGVQPALRSLLPPRRIGDAWPLPLTPPPSIAEWMARSIVDPFTTRTLRDEINMLAGLSINGRQSPRVRLQQALENAKEALVLMEDVSEILNPARTQSQGLLSAIELRRFQEWRSWQLDMELKRRLAQCWLDQFDAAIQYGLFQTAGDAAGLVVATEKVEAARQTWEDIQQFTERHFRHINIPESGGMRELHWNDIKGPFLKDRDTVAEAFEKWNTTGEWNRLIGHWSQRRLPPHEPFLITASVPPNAGLERLDVIYRNSNGQRRQVTLLPTRVDGVRYIEIPPDMMIAGGLEYYFVGEAGGEPFDVRNPLTGKPFVIAVSHDDQPPKMNSLRHAIEDGRTRVTVMADFIDLMGVAEAALLWKPVAGGDNGGEWNRIPMQRSDPRFYASFPLTSAGALYAVEAIDVLGNAIRYPAPPETPYHIIEPYIE